MSKKIPSYFPFPANFRVQTVEKIRKILNRGECLQLVGLPGSGKTLFLTDILSKRLKDYQVFYLDLNLLTEKSAPAAFNLLVYSLFKETPSLEKSQLAVQKIEDLLKYARSKSQKTVLIFDDFENLKDPAFQPFFQTLKSLHSQNRFLLSLIFAVERQIIDYLLFEPLRIRLSENIIFLPPLSKKDSLFFLTEQAKHSGIKLTSKQQGKIINDSGGFMRTLKRLVHTTAEGNLNTALQIPLKNIHLTYHFEELLEALKPERVTLTNLVLGKISPADEENLKTLKNLYILKQNNEFTYPLFFKFLKHKFGQTKTFAETLEEKINLKQPLTRNEYKTLKFLLRNKGLVCAREDIIEAVWGKNALAGVSDHAIDQLVHRLRQKLLSAVPPVNLETIRGRGHRLRFS